MHFTRRRLLRAALCAPALSLAACGDDAVPLPERYAGAVQRVIDLYRIPGVAASVRVPGDAPWQQGFGKSDLASGTPMSLANHFSIRSVTKAYTVTAVLQLVRDKRLALDDKLGKYVGGIPNGDIISIADMAGMQSGIGDYSKSDAFIALLSTDLGRAFTEEELVSYAVPLSPRFTPGASYDYSNTNTVLLGMIAEKIENRPLAEVLAARIFDPLGQSQTTYPSAVALPDPHPTPYEVIAATGAAEPLPYLNPTSLAGSGAMVSTLADMQVGAAAIGDGRLVGAELLARVNQSRPATSGPQYDRYGLGLGILDGWWGHHGDGLGFQAAAFYEPKSLATIAVLVNSTPTGNRPNLNFAQEIFEGLAAVVAAG